MSIYSTRAYAVPVLLSFMLLSTACNNDSGGSGISVPKSSAPSTGSGQIRFAVANDFPAATITSGGSAGAISSADFNMDGIQDLVIANTAGGGPSVLFGRGGGDFESPRVTSSGADASTVEVGDFNEDGIPDIVAASYIETSVTVLLSNGDGDFSPQGKHILGAPVAQLAIADFDMDGHEDIASTSYFGGTISILLGNGDGSFRRGPAVTGANIGLAMTAADLNSDGVPDLVVVESLITGIPQSLLPGEVHVLIGNGDGTFRPRDTYAVGLVPEYVEVGDINGDRFPDLAVANALTNDVSILFGVGDGRFAEEKRFRGGAPGSVSIFDIHPEGAPGLRLADFNRDGNLDLAVIQTITSRVSVFAGDGRGNFSPSGSYDTAGFPEPFLATDLNGDGCVDLAVPGNTPPVGPLDVLTTRVSILLNVSDSCL